jgi:hypothetical protein
MAVVGAMSLGLLVWVVPSGMVLEQIGRVNAWWVVLAVALEVGSCLSCVIVLRYFFPEPSGAASRRVRGLRWARERCCLGGISRRPRPRVCCCVAMV